MCVAGGLRQDNNILLGRSLYALLLWSDMLTTGNSFEVFNEQALARRTESMLKAKQKIQPQPLAPLHMRPRVISGYLCG